MFLWNLILVVINKRFSYFLLIKNLLSKKNYIFRNITKSKVGQIRREISSKAFTVISFSSRVGALQETAVFKSCCRCLLFVPLATIGNHALSLSRYLKVQFSKFKISRSRYGIDILSFLTLN